MKIYEKGDFYYSEIMLKDNCEEYFDEEMAESFREEITELFGYGKEGIRFFGAARIPVDNPGDCFFQSFDYLLVLKYIDNGTTLLISKTRCLLKAALGLK
ncbi:hypothetical protein [Xylanibacter oryzae]|uniref:hypothetical protein n=1 Tax=Xylanibacter oryzae TaxID=185293 RepID=UPI0005639895|nr:hypothetical protein [Xylanibacter oryzae]